jgi:alpha-1,3-glucosyltransferase
VGFVAVLQRLFPLKRGLFEDKVANFWYTISIGVDIRAFVPPEKLALLR